MPLIVVVVQSQEPLTGCLLLHVMIEQAPKGCWSIIYDIIELHGSGSALYYHYYQCRAMSHHCQ
jgi:hypothetical protein